MPDYPVTPGAVTDPFCPTTWQQVLEEVSAHQTVTLPSINGFIAQESTPSVADQDKVWIKISASAPYVIGVFAFQGGDWRAIPAPVGFTYFVDTGAANVWTITTGESIPDNAAFVTGRLWVVRVNNAVSGATTFQIDSFSAKAVKKQNDQALAAGDVVSGQVVLMAYDATSGEFELLTTLGRPQIVSSAILKYTGASALVPQSVTASTETTVSWNTEVDSSGIVTLAAGQITLQTGTYLMDIYVPFSQPSNDTNAALSLRDITGGNTILATASTAKTDGEDDSVLVLKHIVTITAASNTYDVRIFANQNVEIGSPVGLGYSETYQQMSILKIS